MSSPKKYDWLTVDWTKTSKEIVIATGAGHSSVDRARHRFAPETKRPPGKHSIHNWALVDWNKTSREIAKSLNISIEHANRQRRHLAPETVNTPGRQKLNLWKTHGFKTEKEYNNYVRREWRKNNPVSPERKEKIRIRNRENYKPVWQRKGFASKEQWMNWKSENTKCPKCGAVKVMYILKSGAAKGKRKYICRNCFNDYERRLTKGNPGRYAEKARRERRRIPDSYVADLLDIPVTAAKKHPDLIKAKREQVKILRELKPITRKNKHNAQEPE